MRTGKEGVDARRSKSAEIGHHAVRRYPRICVSNLRRQKAHERKPSAPEERKKKREKTHDRVRNLRPRAQLRKQPAPHPPNPNRKKKTKTKHQKKAAYTHQRGAGPKLALGHRLPEHTHVAGPARQCTSAAAQTAPASLPTRKGKLQAKEPFVFFLHSRWVGRGITHNQLLA